jgi:hypothetical protein
MVNSISSTHASQVNEAVKPAATKPQPPQQKSSPLPSDTVSLKSAANVKNGDTQ